MVPSVRRTIEISQLQSIDKVVFVLVVQVVVVSPVQVVEKTGGSHSCSSSRKSLRSASSWTRLLHARWCATRGACRDSAENCGGSAVAALFTVVDISVVAQRLIPMVPVFPKTIEVLHLQYIDKVAHVLVVHVVQVSQVLSV